MQHLTCSIFCVNCHNLSLPNREAVAQEVRSGSSVIAKLLVGSAMRSLE